jgi:2-polyprenyl-3-methyl-5-hydroxy-6-metoxy-1,4-benzoquinol methylase
VASVIEETSGRRCPACADARAVAQGEKNGCPLVACRACGTLYAPRAGVVAPLDYDGYYGESNLSVPAFIGSRLDEIFAGFAPYRATNRLLDIGCGAGSLLQAARRAGWDAEGLEVSKTAAEHVRGEGFRVFCGELAEAAYPSEHFDVLTASEVLEHLTDPLPLLEEAARILRPGGLLWATTPHGRGLSARLLGARWSTVCPTEHLQLFSLAGARRVFRRAGFRRVRVTSRGCNPAEIWHALRHRGDGAHAAATDESAVVKDSAVVESSDSAKPSGGERFDRVASGYRLNEALLRNPATRALKSAVNAALGATRLGDSINIRAEK